MTAAVLVILFAIGAGYPAAVRLSPTDHWRDRLGNAILIGFGILFFSILLLSIFHIRWSLPAILLTVATAVLVSILCPRPRGSKWPAQQKSSHRIDRAAAGLLWLLIVTVLVGYARFATAAPVMEFDFLINWGLKGRLFYLERGIDWSYLEQASHRGIHPDYPLFLPFLFSLAGLLEGSWNDQSVGLLNVAFAVPPLLIVSLRFRERVESATASAMLLLALLPTLLSPWLGLGDGPLAAYFLVALLMLRDGIDHDDGRGVLLGAVLLGIAANIKNEGVAAIASTVVALLVVRLPLRRWIHLWPAAVLTLPWLILRHQYDLQTDLAAGSPWTRLSGHLAEIDVLIASIAGATTGNIWFWIGLTIGFFWMMRPILAEERLLLVFVIVQSGFYLAAYLITPHDIDWHVIWSWERLVSHLAPILTFAVLIHLAPRLHGLRDPETPDSEHTRRYGE